MKKTKKRMLLKTGMRETLFFFVFGALAYSTIEILWRGYTHWTMALLGGIVMVLLNFTENLFTEAPIIFKSIVGAGIITVLELIFGVIINRRLNLGVWSYHDVEYNILGQICPLFTFLWFLLCIAAFLIIRSFKRVYGKHGGNGGNSANSEDAATGSNIIYFKR